ncbi:DUF4136 domain-containing protein [Shewanella sp.]|nr:DUF4136 domain-containing protein [Shewanella sp.]
MKKLLVIVTALVLSACSSLRTSYDYDPDINFSDVKTYAWIETKTPDSTYQLGDLMDRRVRAAVNNQLQQKGLTLVPTDKADILINYLTKVDKKINIDTFNNNFGYNPYYGPYYGPNWGWGWGGAGHSQTTVREYDVGTLILDMIEAKTGQLIWRGSVADTVRDQGSPDERTQVVNKAIGALLTDYPPKPGK